MALNSANCKTWCITAVSALLVVGVDKQRADVIRILFLPVILFGLLDAYYLGMERRFRTRYDNFIAKLGTGSLVAGDLFLMRPDTSGDGAFLATMKGTTSFSVAPFYILVLSTIVWARWAFLGP